MIQIPNPNDKQWRQTNRGNQLGNPYYAPLLGNLWSTMNADLWSNYGAFRLGNRLKIWGTKADSGLSNMTGAPTSFTAWGGYIWAISGNRIFHSTTGVIPTSTWVEDSSTSAQTNYSGDSDDLCAFNGYLCALNCTMGRIYNLNSPVSGTWTNGPAVVGGGANGQLCYFKKFNRLYVTNSANIHSVDTSWTISTSGNSYDLTFSNNNDGGNIQCIAAGADRLWIGMKRGAFGGTADNSGPNPWCSVYEWDGISNQPTKEYKIPALGVMSIIMDMDVPIIMDTEGVVRKFNGQGFEEVGRLPIRRGESLLVAAQPNWTQNFIHPKGLAITKDHTLLALINNQTLVGYNNANQLIENLPSGIWEFDLKGSAVHRHSFSLMRLTSTSVTDHGQNQVFLIGSLGYIKPPTTNASGIYQVLAGAGYYTDASTVTYGVFMNAPSPTDTSTYPEGQKYGYFVSQWLPASQVKEIWRKAFLKYRQLLDSGDKITMKYRTTEAKPIDISITWATTTTFTTTTDLTPYIGYEVEVLAGTGSGKCSHITSVVNNSGTYTVTVDETYTGVTTGTAKARIQNWTKVGSSVTDQTSGVHEFSIEKSSHRIQIKVCLQFMGDDEVQELAVVSSVQQPWA